MNHYLVAASVALVCSAAEHNVCQYTPHRNTTFLGSNVILCIDNEGLNRCSSRCTEDVHCAGFGLYVAGPAEGRCCTKRTNTGASAWQDGVSYSKQVSRSCPLTPSPPPPSPPPAPPSAAVTISYIFKGNATYPYNKGAMLQVLPGGRLAAAFQAGTREAAADQRVLYGISEGVCMSACVFAGSPTDRKFKGGGIFDDFPP